jgi:hypothetical protein
MKNSNEMEIKRAELLEMTEGLNEHGLDLLLFWANECLSHEKYQASTSPERLQEIHEAEVAGVEARAAEANDRYRRPGILTEIGKRSDYLKVMGDSTPYGKEFEEIYNSPFDDPVVRAIDFFALGCIATERDMKQKPKRARKTTGVK